MKKYKNECVRCSPPLRCLGSSCTNRRVPHHSCDRCGVEDGEEKIFDYEGEELCLDCIIESLDLMVVM